MPLESMLLEILRCPDTDHVPLTYDEAAQTLTCTVCRRVYGIEDGIPVLLLDQAVSRDAAGGGCRGGCDGGCGGGGCRCGDGGCHGGGD